jgi:EAL domain-containing protein (putative c-di-GMP-specific phosphodiesterase class I)
MRISTPDDDAPRGSGALPAKGLSFLVVEDHEFQRAMMVEMLEEIGASAVHEAADGLSALEVIRELEHPFDVIVTDIDMPGMDGMAFIRRLGEVKARPSLVITSALERSLLDTVETMAGAYGMRLLGTIEKPPTPERFADLVALYWKARPNPERSGKRTELFTMEEIVEGLHGEQFVPYYQPKIELRTGRVKGAEALARWERPHEGLILPYAFIGQLEESEQIAELTWIMLAQAARDCRTWREAGMDMDVSVNLSVKLLADPAIAEAITWQVANQGLDPRHMILEITESAAMSSVGHVLENLIRLRMKGFGLSIDDYGTGYSSMQQLTRIPFTELKIDQSFVMHAAHQEASRMILESSLEMARRLRIVSVAEGAETSEDWNLLREVGCDLAQGFYVAGPMPGSQFPDWVRSWA